MKFVVTVLVGESSIVSGFYNNNDKKDMLRTTSILNVRETSSRREIHYNMLVCVCYCCELHKWRTSESKETRREQTIAGWISLAIGSRLFSIVRPRHKCVVISLTRRQWPTLQHSLSLFLASSQNNNVDSTVVQLCPHALHLYLALARCLLDRIEAILQSPPPPSTPSTGPLIDAFNVFH